MQENNFRVENTISYNPYLKTIYVVWYNWQSLEWDEGSLNSNSGCVLTSQVVLDNSLNFPPILFFLSTN